MFELQNRRYLGCKFRLLPFIDKVINEKCADARSLVDLFAGTGVVAWHFNRRFQIFINDILLCNHFIYHAFFSPEKADTGKLVELICGFNSLNGEYHNYYRKNFADTYLSSKNMGKTGHIRDAIDRLEARGAINFREKAILVASLLYAVDRIANTVGHYDAWRRNGELDRTLTLEMPALDDSSNAGNLIFREDAVRVPIKADIAYLDPPYNSRQYCDCYHFLENLAGNRKEPVKGVARKIDRSGLKSRWCTASAPFEFGKLIARLEAKYILVSYSNTGQKLDSRSNARISDSEIIGHLRIRGRVSVFEHDFSPFSAGKSEIADHSERLFLCEVGKHETTGSGFQADASQTVKSPLNYTGGKYRILPQIMARIPSRHEVFYDVFSGGANVGINMNAREIVFVDNNRPLIELMEFLRKSDFENLVADLDRLIAEYGFSDSMSRGYGYYGCESSGGLGQFNKGPYSALKADYNRKPEPINLLLLIVFGFNNQIRFNSRGEFNLPVGKRDLNRVLRKRLRLFMERLGNINAHFEHMDFRDLDIGHLKERGAFLYLDPPYSLGLATYNENGWDGGDDSDLMEFLLECDGNGLRFALSNVLLHKGQKNDALLEWCLKTSMNISHLSCSYSNSSYHKLDRNSETQEVLITNF